jgi:hypothetical protein
LETILNEIDQALLSTFKNKGLKAYGLCELITKDKKVNPVTCNKTRDVAQIHDAFNGIFYHRILSSNPFQEDEEFSFGSIVKRRHSKNMRLVMAFKVELGENFVNEFINEIPDKITTLSNYKFVFLGPGTLIEDHEAVTLQEYGQIPYEKHRTSWNIYALEYDIDFMLC